MPPPAGARDEVARLRNEVGQLRAEVARLSERITTGPPDPAQVLEAARSELRAEANRLAEGVVADLRARIVALTETNLLLLEADDELDGVAATMQSAAQKYRRAPALFMTPGHPGQRTETTGTVD